MAASSAGYHESLDLLKSETQDRHRAIASLMEELEAVDWYDQRVDATQDASLAAILAHNRDEEKEHAAMVLEWLRRRDPQLDLQLRNYLVVDRPVLAQEHALESDGDAASAHSAGTPATGDGSLGIGSLRAEGGR
jgi:ferritin-like protein